jgi:GNAT superfamily N-acetyltransferase
MTEIVRLTPAEGSRLRELRLRSLRDAPYAFRSSYEEFASLPDDAWTRQLAELVTFVAVARGRDVGIVRGAPHHQLPRAAALRSMWVASEARGQGVGDALVGAVLDWARAAGFRRVVLDVVDDNAAAIALYARHGFEPSGVTSSLPAPREHVGEHQRTLTL